MNFVKQLEATIRNTFYKADVAGRTGINLSSLKRMTFCFNFYIASLSLILQLA